MEILLLLGALVLLGGKKNPQTAQTAQATQSNLEQMPRPASDGLRWECFPSMDGMVHNPTCSRADIDLMAEYMRQNNIMT